MNITEYAINKKLSGGGKRTGTAIKADQYLYKLYFNTHNSVEETNAILSKLTFVQTPFLEYPIYIAYANTVDSNYGSFIVVTDVGDGTYTIGVVTNIAEMKFVNLYTGVDYGADIYNGWVCPVDQETSWVVAGAYILSQYNCVTDIYGIPVGLENEKIKNVLSTTPF